MMDYYKFSVLSQWGKKASEYSTQDYMKNINYEENLLNIKLEKENFKKNR